MMTAILGLISIVPGAGTVFGLIGSIIGAVLRCKPCLIILAIGVAFLWGDIHGHHQSDAACKANDLAMQLKAAQRDASIQKDAADFAKVQIDALDAENAALNRKLTDYEKAPHTVCPLGDRARRLHEIAPR